MARQILTFKKLPKILDWYSKDFAPNTGSDRELLAALLPYMPEGIADKIKFFETSSIKVKFKGNYSRFA